MGMAWLEFPHTCLSYDLYLISLCSAATVLAFGFLKAACCGDVCLFSRRHWKTNLKRFLQTVMLGERFHLSLLLTKISACGRWSNPGGPASFSYSPEAHLLWHRGRESSWHTAPLGEILSTLSLFSNCWIITKLWTLLEQFNTTYLWLL